MQLSVKFFEIEFKNPDSKKAYLQACKWLAKYVISKVEIGETFWNVEKVKDTDFPTFKVKLYAMMDEIDGRNGFCNKCQTFHRTFYINQQYNCNSCNMAAYMVQMESKLSIKRNYRDERLRYILNKEED